MYGTKSEGTSYFNKIIIILHIYIIYLILFKLILISYVNESTILY